MFVDDDQSTGTHPLDVRTMPIDALTMGTVKFLLGSPGVGLLYVREAVVERLAPRLPAGSLRPPREMQIDAYRPAPSARRFQVGSRRSPRSMTARSVCAWSGPPDWTRWGLDRDLDRIRPRPRRGGRPRIGEPG